LISQVDSPNHFLATSIDLTRADAVQTMVDETVKRFGRVDVLVNTVGGYRTGTSVHEDHIGRGHLGL
jgi:NADP-dependent 3-hydroxy acid dehydrogenase YdfG